MILKLERNIPSVEILRNFKNDDVISNSKVRRHNCHSDVATTKEVETANPQGSQNAEICFKWSDLSPDEKKAPRRRTSSGAWSAPQTKTIPSWEHLLCWPWNFVELFSIDVETDWLQTLKRRGRKFSSQRSTFRGSFARWRGTLEKLPANCWVTFDGSTGRFSWKSLWGQLNVYSTTHEKC